MNCMCNARRFIHRNRIRCFPCSSCTNEVISVAHRSKLIGIGVQMSMNGFVLLPFLLLLLHSSTGERLKAHSLIFLIPWCLHFDEVRTLLSSFLSGSSIHRLVSHVPFRLPPLTPGSSLVLYPPAPPSLPRPFANLVLDLSRPRS
jgi:hypothetical protein